MSAVAHIRLLSEPIDDGGGLAELGPISPELALVDPELALAARALLPDRPTFEAPPPPAPALAALVAPAEAVAPSAVASGLGVAGPSTTADGAFVLRHFAAGILVGLLAAVLVVEVYILLEPFRSGRTSERAVSSPRLAAPTPGEQPTVVAPPASRLPPAGANSGTTATAPTAPPSTRLPPAGANPGTTATTPAMPKATTLAWPAKPGAAAYRVTLLQAGRPILVRTTRTPRLPVPVRWRYGGAQHRLVPGSYRWLVVPLRRVGGTLRPGEPVVDAEYVVPRARS